MNIVKRNFSMIVVSSSIMGGIGILFSIALTLMPGLIFDSIYGATGGADDAITGLIGFFAMIFGPLIMLAMVLIIGSWLAAVIGFSCIAKSSYIENPQNVGKYQVLMAITLAIYAFPGVEGILSFFSSLAAGFFDFVSLAMVCVFIPIAVICCINTYSSKLHSQTNPAQPCTPQQSQPKPWD